MCLGYLCKNGKVEKRNFVFLSLIFLLVIHIDCSVVSRICNMFHKFRHFIPPFLTLSYFANLRAFRSPFGILRSIFFTSSLSLSLLTVNVDKIGVNTACVRLMPDVEYVQILINRKEKKLLLKPCDEIEITGYRWGRTKDGKRYPSQRTGELFVLTLCEIMDWNPDYRYKVLGKMVQANGKALIAFDLTSSECFPKVVNRDGKKVSSRQSVFAEQWSGKFGPTYSESRRSLAVKTFDNYTVITVNGKKTEVHPQAQPQQQGSMGDSL